MPPVSQSLMSSQTVLSPKSSFASKSRRKPPLFCFSHLRWDFVYQRPQHLLTRAARIWDVIVFEEPVLDARVPRLDITDRPGGVRIAVPHLPEGIGEAAAFAAQREMIDDLVQSLGMPDVVWHYAPMAMAFARHLTPRVRVYDCMDELSAFKNAPPMLPVMERRLFGAADLVFTGGQSLYEAKRTRHPRVHAFPSSIDVAHFGRARGAGNAGPADQARIPGPRLGFFGVVDERMDTALLAETARLRPDWQFIMIGPVVKIDPADLPRLPNLHWLGSKPYAELPEYIAGWDVGLMPFAICEATRYISPTKTPEFLAAGVPVVSTPITDVVRPYGENGLVAIARTAEEVVAQAEALMSADRAAWLARVDAHLANMSWDRTWAAMAGLIGDPSAAPNRRAEGARRPTASTGEGVLHVV
jgi:glycosyltransferase involved in cell wall biosynthesis